MHGARKLGKFSILSVPLGKKQHGPANGDIDTIEEIASVISRSIPSFRSLCDVTHFYPGLVFAPAELLGFFIVLIDNDPINRAFVQMLKYHSCEFCFK